MPRVYLDHNATTPVHPKVLEAMLPWFTEHWHHPSSPYPAGQRAADAVRLARGEVAKLVGGTPAEIVFTSGGSESISAAFASSIRGSHRGRVVLSSVEHSAAKRNAEQSGAEVVVIEVDETGQLDRDGLFAAIDDRVAIVSLTLANNETGVLTNIEGVGDACRAVGATFHLDAVQGPGKLPLDLPATGADLASISAHKVHGPKGVGALWLRPGASLRPLVYGGPQENLRRAGTENVPGIVGFGRAAALARAHVSDPEALRAVAARRDRLEEGIVEQVEGARVHGSEQPRTGNTSNIHLPGNDARTLLLLLAELGVEASAGSACNAQSSGPSPVLLAMGFDEDEASESLRFSLGRATTDADIANALAAVGEALQTLSALG